MGWSKTGLAVTPAVGDEVQRSVRTTADFEEVQTGQRALVQSGAEKRLHHRVVAHHGGLEPGVSREVSTCTRALVRPL